MIVGVSSRTRSKNVPLYGSLSLHELSSKRRKNEEDDMCFGSRSKKRKVNKDPSVFPENAEVICIDDENGDAVVEKKQECCVDIKKEVKSEENGGSNDVFVDEKLGLTNENPVVLCSDESNDEEHSDSDSDESEDEESTDSEFNVDEMNAVSESDEDGSSCSSYVDEEEEKKCKRNGLHKYVEMVGELVRKVKDDEKIEVSKRKNKEVKIESSLSSVHKNESEHEDDGSVTTTTALEKKGFSDTMEGCSSSKGNVTSERQKEKNVEMTVKKVSDVDVNTVKAKAKSKARGKVKVEPSESVNLRGLGEGDGNVSLTQTEKKVIKNKGRDYKGGANIENDKKKATVDNNGLNHRGKSTLFMQKEFRLFELLADCYFGKKENTVKNDSTPLEVKNDGVNCLDTRPPPASVETPPLIWSLKKKVIVQKTKEEEEIAELWDEMERCQREMEAEAMIGKNETTHQNKGNSSTRCEHDLCLEEEIGVYCRLCGWVKTEMKYVSPLVVDKFTNEGYRKRTSFDDGNVSHFDGSQFKVSHNDSESNISHNQGTVWDLLPDVKQTLYPHQQEGFEFIWKNLAGSIDLHKLKNADPQREGGCIISHAPGTGKTRLTIVFLGAYLKIFPKCLPLIVAPAGLLNTWEEEFKKWDIGVPFHNLNKLELSGKEHADARNLLNWSSARHSADPTRMAKLISWYKEKSILGISYNMYEKLAGGGRSDEDKGKEIMGNVLREKPGLFVLDEGHTPRNKTSGIWKVLSITQTKKRIILSGTPFQNNFLELYNILSIVKPSFPNMLPNELKRFCQKPEHKKATKEWSWEPDSGNTSDDKIRQLKLLMDPFVHVHKGAILQKKLPGIRNRVLRLKADSLQKQVLDSIQSSQGSFVFEHKLTMASIHPSLFLECDLLEKEKSVLHKDQLEKVRLDPYRGVKTKFLLEFVKLCDAADEKVLVFSQFIKPLRLLIEQLSLACKWTEGKEMLFMDGEVDLKGKQSLIHNFNDANCQAKILLASVKACCEGISLVGASRVVLLDVVWNPSVKRQAISRAYRIGQKRIVYTYHLLIEGTAECVKHRKQAEKDRLSELVFQTKNDNDGELKNCDVNFEDSILDKMIRHKELKDMFVE